MRVPVDPPHASGFGPLIDTVDQGPPDAFAARRFAREQILQVTIRLNRDRAAMEQVVRQAKQLAVKLSNQRVHRFIRIEETGPSHLRNFGRESSRSPTPVKRVVSIPQREPLVVILPRYRANHQLVQYAFRSISLTLRDVNTAVGGLRMNKRSAGAQIE